MLEIFETRAAYRRFQKERLVKRFIVSILSIVLIIGMTGCNSKPVSKTFSSDMETTWNAVLRAAEKVSKDKPATIDVVNRKVVTGWGFANVNQGVGGFPGTKSTDIWRGIIICEKTKSGTKVSVSVEKGGANVEDSNRTGTPPDNSITYTFKSDDTSLQKKYLAMVEEELKSKSK